MLTPRKPEDDSPEELARYERDLKHRAENPKSWGYFPAVGENRPDSARLAEYNAHHTAQPCSRGSGG